MTFTRVNIDQASQLLEEQDTIVVDIRDTESFRDGHIPGSVHLTQDNLNNFIEKTERSAHILVVCYHGNSSQIVAEYLSGYGFGKVHSLDGGYDGWKNANMNRK